MSERLSADAISARYALARRGLFARHYARDAADLPILAVRLTTAGRVAARAGTGTTVSERLPPGTLREWHWRALARAYAAGAAGLPGEYGDYGGIGWRTWLRLREHRAGALVAERVITWQSPASLGEVSAPVYRLFLTGVGGWFYAEDWAAYRARYPAVEAAAPNGER